MGEAVCNLPKPSAKPPGLHICICDSDDKLNGRLRIGRPLTIRDRKRQANIRNRHICVQQRHVRPIGLELTDPLTCGFCVATKSLKVEAKRCR